MCTAFVERSGNELRLQWIHSDRQTLCWGHGGEHAVSLHPQQLEHVHAGKNHQDLRPVSYRRTCSLLYRITRLLPQQRGIGTTLLYVRLDRGGQ